jgi:hypothetical protein
VAGSSFTKWFDFKSPLRVVVAILLRSRELLRGRNEELRCALTALRRENELLKEERDELRARQDEAEAEVRRLKRELLERSENAVRTLPADPPLGSHGYGARMIELSLRLAQAVGFRPAATVMQIFFAWLQVKQRVPHHTGIRNWMQRLGVAALNQPLKKADDWIWMSDHSNQIGQDKILVVLAVRAAHLPPPGKALQQKHMKVLAVQPGKSWKREDVARVNEDLAKIHGAPRAALSDGAVELRDGAEPLKKQRRDCILLQDFKHKAANFLEAELGRTTRFSDFTAEIGRTRAAIQQTALAHLTPPALRTKARFMNLGTLLKWGPTILWLLDHPEAKTRQELSTEQLDSKLGWLRNFRTDLAGWQECQQVIQRGLKFINTQGLFVGASDQLRTILMADLNHCQSRNLADRLIDFVKNAESQLKPGERLPMSTEILESSFGKYKQLEGQHAKGGFTTLIPALAGLLQNPTPSKVRKSFARTSNKDLKEWLKKNIKQTVASQRAAVYREMRQATQPKEEKATKRAKKTKAAA